MRDQQLVFDEEPRRSSRISLWLGLTVVGLAIAAGVALWAWDRQMRDRSRDAVAARQAARMLIAHLKANHDRWPRSWDELRPHYTLASTAEARALSFGEIKRRVIIDFFFDPKQSAARAGFDPARFRAIYLQSGWSDEAQPRDVLDAPPPGANELVCDYLRASMLREQAAEQTAALEAFMPPGRRSGSDETELAQMAAEPD